MQQAVHEIRVADSDAAAVRVSRCAVRTVRGDLDAFAAVEQGDDALPGCPGASRRRLHSECGSPEASARRGASASSCSNQAVAAATGRQVIDASGGGERNSSRWRSEIAEGVDAAPRSRRDGARRRSRNSTFDFGNHVAGRQRLAHALGTRAVAVPRRSTWRSSGMKIGGIADHAGIPMRTWGGGDGSRRISSLPEPGRKPCCGSLRGNHRRSSIAWPFAAPTCCGSARPRFLTGRGIQHGAVRPGRGGTISVTGCSTCRPFHE